MWGRTAGRANVESSVNPVRGGEALIRSRVQDGDGEAGEAFGYSR